MPLMNEMPVIDFVTKLAAPVIENQLGFTQHVNRQYDQYFAKSGQKIGQTARVRLPARYISSNGANLTVQPAQEDVVPVTVDKRLQISVPFTTAEQTMDVNEYETLLLKPALSQLANDIDSYIASNAYKDAYMSVGTPGTTPATSQVLLNAHEMMTNYGCTPDNRFLVVNPAANYALVEGLKGLYNPSNIISEQYKSGQMMPSLQFSSITCSQNITRHTTGTRNVTGTVATTISTQGASTIALAGLGANATVLKGDVFTVAGVYQVNYQNRQSVGNLQQFVVTADVTADGSGNATVGVSPAMYTAAEQKATISAFPQASAVVTFLGAANTSYPQNIFFQPEALTLVTVDLEKPSGGIESKIDTYKGVRMRVMEFYNPETDQNTIRFDILAGCAVVRKEKIGRIWG